MDLEHIGPQTQTCVVAGQTLRPITARDVAALVARYSDFFEQLTRNGLPVDYANAMLACAAGKRGDEQAEAFFDTLPHGLHIGAANWVVAQSWPPFGGAASSPQNSSSNTTENKAADEPSPAETSPA